MDLLKSLNLEDLPEQQTRTGHLLNESPDFDLSLGFDACCVCGASDPVVECKNCHRVKYCSPECCEKDATASTMDGNEDEMEARALGHSAVVCSILALCNDDEAVENSNEHMLDTTKREKAVDRLVSEFESYPATLANIIMDGPCYQDALTKATRGSLNIHIIGASVDSELWEGHPIPSQESKVYHSYAEAFAEIADRFHLNTIHLYFIGPDCPKKDSTREVKVPFMAGSKNECILKAFTIRAEYTENTLSKNDVANSSIVAFFNPGFTVPDYSWEEALLIIPQGTPCLSTTNTELEGMADIEFLYEAGLIRELPAALSIMLKGEMLEHSDSFFSVNPHCGSRVRQSGTMGNDLYVKSRWVFGGVFGKMEETPSRASGKKQKIVGSGNSKETNPALV